MAKLASLFLLIFSGFLCIWFAEAEPECTSRENVLKYHQCMVSIYGIENVYRQQCIMWADRKPSRNVTEPTCLHHLKRTSKSPTSNKNQTHIQVSCRYFAELVLLPEDKTVALTLQSKDPQCDQDEEIEYQLPKMINKYKPNPKCEKPIWDQNGITVAGNLMGPRAVYVDRNDNLYVADRNHQRLQKFSKSSKIGKTIAVGASGKPVDVGIDTYGNIYKATGKQWIVKRTFGPSISFSNRELEKDCYLGVIFHNGTDMYVSKPIGNSSSMIRKYSLSSSPRDRMVAGVKNRQSHAVFVDQCDTYKALSTEEENIEMHLDKSRPSTRGYIEPVALVPHHRYPGSRLFHFGSDYIVNREGNQVRKADQGVVVGETGKNNTSDKSVRSSTVPAKTNSGQLNEPMTIAFDSQSNLYVADFKNNRVQKFLLRSGSVKC